MQRGPAGLPGADETLFLTDGGLETTLVFIEGIDLPCFAAYPLIETAEGRERLERYFRPYLETAARHGAGFLLDTPTWRANADWGARLGHDAAALSRVNRESVRWARALRERLARPGSRVLVNGVVGPRGDGYRVEDRMSAEEAARYHAVQVGTLAGAGVDMITAVTINTPEEACGIATAAAIVGVPCAISFTVETDGRLASGATLEGAIAMVDAATGGAPLYYMVNCAHPLHLAPALERGGAWTIRLGGLRANASTKSHAELDAATELDPGDPADLGRRYRMLQRQLPRLRVMGGCCGTDHRHVAAICEACAPPIAA
ncbi:homocysteine S-methyltransferase family protein [Alsobacter sp. R-9]